MKKNLSLIISFIGIVSIAGGLLLIKTLENPNEFILTLSYMIIPELSEPPVRTLGATIPENESHIFR